MKRILMVSALLFVGSANAANKSQAVCADEPVKNFVAVMSEWHALVGGLAAVKQPSLGKIAGLRAEMEGLALERAYRRFAWSAKHDVERLEIKSSIPSALDMPWTDIDEKRLRLAEPDYADLSDRWRRVEQSERKHPKREALQRSFTLSVMGSDTYRKAIEDLLGRIEPVNEAFEKCGNLKARKLQSLTE